MGAEKAKTPRYAHDKASKLRTQINPRYSSARRVNEEKGVNVRKDVHRLPAAFGLTTVSYSAEWNPALRTLKAERITYPLPARAYISRAPNATVTTPKQGPAVGHDGNAFR